jgi:molybdopterin synthase sulfur carrier subunit
MTAKLHILYFAWVREQIGTGEEAIDHPGEEIRVIDLIEQLAARSGGHAEALSQPGKLRAALDQSFVSLEAPLGGATELAIFPPVTGG